VSAAVAQFSTGGTSDRLTMQLWNIGHGVGKDSRTGEELNGASFSPLAAKCALPNWRNK